MMKYNIPGVLLQVSACMCVPKMLAHMAPLSCEVKSYHEKNLQWNIYIIPGVLLQVCKQKKL